MYSCIITVLCLVMCCSPYAFVTFPSLECAQDAWAVMDGNREFYGRRINIQASYWTMADEDDVRNEAAGLKSGRGRGA